MTGTLFPVGHYTGVVPAAIGTPDHVVRVGTTQHRLSEQAFGIWILTHGRTGGGPWTRKQVLAEARHVGLADAASSLSELEASGLAVAIPAELQATVDVFHAYRLEALLIGLGDVPDRPGHQRLGVPETGPIATLDPDSYELWQWAATTPSLWTSCELRAAVTTGSRQLDDPHQAVAGVLRDLRVLVALGCAYLDVVRGRR